MRRVALTGSLFLSACFSDPAEISYETDGGGSSTGADAPSGSGSPGPATTPASTSTEASSTGTLGDASTSDTGPTSTSSDATGDETATTSSCRPDCDGRLCGDDGCGGVCGACAFNETCADEGATCQTIVAGCEDTAGYQPGSPWPTLGYCETRLFRSPLSGPTDEPAVLWTYDIAQPLGDIVVAADGTIYGGAGDGSLHAVDGSDGSERWVFALGAEPALQAPALGADGSIYIQTQSPISQSGRLYKISPEGAEIWDVSAGSGLEVSTSPLIASDGTVYVVSGATVLGFGPDDGAVVFESDFLNSEFGAGGLARGPGGRFYIAGEDRLYGIEPNGQDFWEYALGDDAVLQSYPAVSEDGVYFTGRGFIGYLVLLDLEDGSLVAERSPVSVDDSLALSATGRVFFGTTNAIVVSSNPSNGMLFDQWSEAAPQAISGELLDYWTGRVTVDRLGNSYRGWFDGSVHGVGPTGDALWSIDLGGDLTAAVVVAPDETLLVPGGDGLTALRVE